MCDPSRRSPGSNHRIVAPPARGCERSQDGLGRGVHRTAGPFVPAPRGARRLQRFGQPGRLQDVGDLTDLLEVDPAHHVGHGAATYGRGEEERGQQFRRRGVPELPIGRRAVGFGRFAQVGRHAPRPGPRRADAQWGPFAGRCPGRPGRIDAPHLAPSGAVLPRVSQKVALDAGRQHGALPPQDGRHGQGAGLPALGRPHHHQRLRRFGHHPSRRPAARGGAQGRDDPDAVGAMGRGADRGRGARPIGRRGTAPSGGARASHHGETSRRPPRRPRTASGITVAVRPFTRGRATSSPRRCPPTGAPSG